MAVTVPDWADTLLDLVGVNWPNVDEDAYREMADALREFADDLADDGRLANNHMERLLSSRSSWWPRPILVENPSTRSFVVPQICPTRGQHRQIGTGLPTLYTGTGQGVCAALRRIVAELDLELQQAREELEQPGNVTRLPTPRRRVSRR
ncbi:hypothetical protein ACN9M0_00440 [Streptomyces sp. R-07]|uniref:hypothetical protein n=1 Tax=Streptomyces sp. R-07 TaxID=3404052 RepID=UPI003CF0FCC6